MSKILITGATGLIGTNLTERLEKKHDLYLVSRKLGLDLLDARQIQYLMAMIKPDVVYHLAANASESQGQVSPIDMTQQNIGIFTNTLRAAINTGVKKFIYTSSVAVYGDADTPYIEFGETLPKDVYGVNKLACEQMLKIMAKTYGFEYVILRPHNIYGPHQNMASPHRNIIALTMRNLMEKRPIMLYGEGLIERSFSFVGDVVDILESSLKPKFSNLTMNVGSDVRTTLRDLVTKVQVAMGMTGQTLLLPARSYDIFSFYSSHTLQNTLTSYHETSLDKGLKKTWEWVKAQGLPRLQLVSNEIYV